MAGRFLNQERKKLHNLVLELKGNIRVFVRAGVAQKWRASERPVAWGWQGPQQGAMFHACQDLCEFAGRASYKHLRKASQLPNSTVKSLMKRKRVHIAVAAVRKVSMCFAAR